MAVAAVAFVTGAVVVFAEIRDAIYVGIAALSLLFAWFMIETARMLRQKRARFRTRPELPLDELERLFSTRTVTRCDLDRFLTRVERATDIPKGKLRPDDRFAVELAPVRGWEFDDGLNLLPLVLQRDFGGSIEDYDLGSDATVKTLLAAVQRAVTMQTRQEQE